ncbi:MAG: PBP1A family penicillin-binding protein [Oligoflexia bacterium]|nr:PBP1A family penicillin-binding protein [Oligoflexia bacterium]
MKKIKYIIAGAVILALIGVLVVTFAYFTISSQLPKMITLEDYKPLLVSEVYDRTGQKVGEFFREKRIVIPYEKIPKQLIHAFVSAEDSQFFQHGGINFVAITRAAIANLKAGHTVQGGSTITQQVAKTLLLSPERTLDRKMREAILAYRMEKNLSKEDILFLYLNQIYLGHGAHGVEAAAQNYFRKSVDDLTLAEASMLAGLPQAPGKYSPVLAPDRAKERQLYVLGRMAEDGYVTSEQAKAAAAEPVKVYYREAFEDVAPFYKEIVRQYLNVALGEEKVLNEGIKIYTAMDLPKQLAAQEAVEKNLRDLDKRQGFRGVTQNIKEPEEIAAFLIKERDELLRKKNPFRIVSPDAKEPPKPPLDLVRKPGQKNLPDYAALNQLVDGIVTKVDSKFGLVTVRFAETQGLIDIDEMGWARVPDPTKHHTEDIVKDPAKVLKVGDVIEVRITAEKFNSPRIAEQFKKKKQKPADLPSFDEYLHLQLEQKPSVEAGLLSYDLHTNDVLAMVGGRDFNVSKLNRTMQSRRQTGSAFKAFVYAAALERGFTAATLVTDAPIVYEEGEGQETKKWKPGNFEGRFQGDITFRTALIKSLNIPTVKILEKIGIDWANKYSRRLGIFSPLNQDFTMALGSSGVTLYEMTRAFGVFAKGGKRMHPILVRKVTDFKGQNVLLENLSIDEKFKDELAAIEEEFKTIIEQASTQPPAPETQGPPVPGQPVDILKAFKFDDPDQLISTQTAYLTTSLLKGVIENGTGFRARAMERPLAGKTGTTNGYYDAWFIGYSPQVISGVWVGYDQEKPIGRLETGASAALPIWIQYMTEALKELPPIDFPVPQGIVFANVDSETGLLASARSKKTVRSAFREGTEPTEATQNSSEGEDKNFLKEDLSE